MIKDSKEPGICSGNPVPDRLSQRAIFCFRALFMGLFFSVIFTVMAGMLIFLTSAAFSLKKIKAPLTQVKIKAEITIAFRLLPKPAC